MFPDDRVVPFTARHPRHAVTDALRAAGADAATCDRAIVLPLPRPALYEGWLGPGWPRLPRLDGSQLVHAPSVAVPPHPRVPLVVTVHDAAPELFPESFPARGRRFHRRGLAAASSRADMVLTVSEAAADEILGCSTIRPERIRVVPNGVAPRPVDPASRAAILAARGLAGRPFVLWVGSLEPRKGVDTLVAAMARLRAPNGGSSRGGHEKPLLVLAGYPGWLAGEVAASPAGAALGSALRQLGPVAEDELWSLYAGATVFAFPSRHEGFGLPVIEAMSQGTPVVASDIPAVREVADGAARLIPPDDVEGWAAAIEDLLADGVARDRLARAGQERARQFDVARTISGIRAVYQELLGR